MKKERNCLLCRKPTTGSVGAAGIKWKNVCQPCKDAEDKAALAQLKGASQLFKSIVGQ